MMKCTLCMEPYSMAGEHVPMVLDCSHTICKSCTNKLSDGGRCPTCQRRVSGKPRTNFAIRDIIAAASAVLRCENCDQSAASHYCLDCNAVMCPACMDFLHSMRALRGHERCLVADMPPSDMRGVSELRKRLQQVEQQRDEAWREVNRVKVSPTGSTGADPDNRRYK